MPSVNPIGRKQITPSTEPNGTRKGDRKHSQLTNRKGIPRYDDLVTARMLEQTPTISLPMNTVKKQCTSVDWAIVPTVENPSTKHEMIADRLTEWLDGNFNENNDTWDNLLKLWVNDIVSIDTGALELVPTGGPVSHPETGEMEYWLSELYNLDGMVMSKNLTPKDTIPEPPEPAYFKWGNVPNLRGNSLSAEGVGIDRLVREQNLGRFAHGFRQRPVPFSRDEVVWVEENQQPPAMSAYGFGVVQQVRRWAEILLNQDVSNLQHFSQDEYSKGILNIGIENANELDSFRQYWKDEVRGNTDTKLPTVALDDTAEYIPLQETFKELQYLESQEWYMKLVWFLFGETESEMGATEQANVSTSEHDSVQVFFNTTKPRLETIQQAMNNHVLPKKRDYHIVNGELEFRFLFEEHSLIQERQQAKRRDDLQHGVTTANRVLEEEDKEPLPWGDMPPQAVTEFVRAHPEWVAENWGGIEDVPEPTDPDPGGLFSGRPSNTEEGDSGNLIRRKETPDGVPDQANPISDASECSGSVVEGPDGGLYCVPEGVPTDEVSEEIVSDWDGEDVDESMNPANAESFNTPQDAGIDGAASNQDIRIATMDDGREVFVKRGFKSEASGANLIRELGGNAPKTEYNSNAGQVSVESVDGVVLSRGNPDAESFTNAAAASVLIGDADANANNYMVRDDGTVSRIDTEAMGESITEDWVSDVMRMELEEQAEMVGVAPSELVEGVNEKMREMANQIDRNAVIESIDDENLSETVLNNIAAIQEGFEL